MEIPGSSGRTRNVLGYDGGGKFASLLVILAAVSAPSGLYHASIGDFLVAPDVEILGRLARAHGPAIDPTQRDAWIQEIGILKQTLHGLRGTIYLEFDVPRLGSRIDAVVIVGPVVFPVEFKCGEEVFYATDVYQAWDYALDLKNFHKASHDVPLLPILVATDADWSDDRWPEPHADGVYPPRRSNAADLRKVLLEGIALHRGPDVDGGAWGSADYDPTPTIVEAARSLYAGHAVEEITRSDADAVNLSVTSAAVERIIDRSRQLGRKSIVFVTGVPGAGKTLVGLTIATRREGLGATGLSCVCCRRHSRVMPPVDESRGSAEATPVRRSRRSFRTFITSGMRVFARTRRQPNTRLSSTKRREHGTSGRPPNS